jgi:hypothetical protein
MSPSLTADRFATVFGSGRGGDLNDTFAAGQPSVRARAELAELLADRTRGGLTVAVAVLAGQRQLFSSRPPLLMELAETVAARHISFAYREHEDALNLTLDVLGIPETVALPGDIEAACHAAYGDAVAGVCGGGAPLAQALSAAALAAALSMFSVFAGRALAAHLRTDCLNRVLRAGQRPAPDPSFVELHRYVQHIRPEDCEQLVGTAGAELIGCDILLGLNEALEMAAPALCEKLCELGEAALLRREADSRTLLAQRFAGDSGK